MARTSLGVALIGCVLAGLVLAWPVDCLVIRQIDEPDRPVRQVTPLPPGAHFEVAWRHSVEREAWVETFENVEHALVLTATRFKTFGAGVPAHAGRDTRVVDGWVIMSGIDRPVPALAYQAASKRGYRLRIGDGRWQALSRSGQAPLLSFSIEARARAACLWNHVLGPVDVSYERRVGDRKSCPARRESPHRGEPRSRLATSQGAICGPTLRDKRCFAAIQRSSTLAQNDCAARATPRLAAKQRLARTRMKPQQALTHD